MQTLRILTCFTYSIVLTVLLLAPNPDEVVGFGGVSISSCGAVAIHFWAFSVLALLVHGARWPKRVDWKLVGILAIYGIATESLQALVPARAVELHDFTENILGLVAGTGAYWIALLLMRRSHAESTPEVEPEAHTTMATGTID